MNDEVLRAAIVLAVVAVALGVAFVQRRGVAIRRVTRSFDGLDEGVYLFGSETCSSCETMRRRLTDAGVEFLEFGAEAEPEVLRRYRIDKVPAIAKVEPDRSGWLAAGLIAPGRIRRWLASP